jgi:hypothetical protein
MRRLSITSKTILDHDPDSSVLNTPFGHEVLQFFDFLCGHTTPSDPMKTIDQSFHLILFVVILGSLVLLLICTLGPLLIQRIVQYVSTFRGRRHRARQNRARFVPDRHQYAMVKDRYSVQSMFHLASFRPMFSMNMRLNMSRGIPSSDTRPNFYAQQ